MRLTLFAAILLIAGCSNSVNEDTSLRERELAVQEASLKLQKYQAAQVELAKSEKDLNDYLELRKKRVRNGATFTPEEEKKHKEMEDILYGEIVRLQQIIKENKP